MTRITTQKQYKEIYKFIINEFGLNDLHMPLVIDNKYLEHGLGRFTMTKQGKKFKIFMTHNIMKVFNIKSNRHNIQVVKFMQSLNIELNNDSIFIFILLHELGHLHHFIELRDRFEIDFITQKRIKNIEKTLIETILKEPYEMYYSYSKNELYADNFAYRNFYSIYNKLKDNNLINIKES